MHRILIVDHDAQMRKFCRLALRGDSFRYEEAEDGAKALAHLRTEPADLVLLDVDMPGLSGTEVCRRLRQEPLWPHLKIVLTSGQASADEMSEVMLAGADDYLTKPFSIVQLQARVKAALRLKEAQERSDSLNQHLLAANHELEIVLSAGASDMIHARNALVLALAELVGYRDTETGAHLKRLQRYCRILADEALKTPTFAPQLDANFIEMLECCAPLHDIGKVGLPDRILLKPDKLTSEERLIMQTHTTIGSDMLQKVARQHGFAQAFLQMAVEIARHHHERFDGQGYPDGLAGDNIPLAARFVAFADVYDALRSRRAYKPALPHATTMKMMAEGFQGHFDPALMQIFSRCGQQFEDTYSTLAE